MHIVTAGSAYMDIDAYACCVAYAELLQAQGKQACAVATGPLNESITATIRSWQAPLLTDYRPNDSDRFSLMDVSDPKNFDHIVDLARVETVIDHHPGFEHYWQERIGDGTIIDFIGAAATLVYEQWVAADKRPQMTELSARLLICAILDNTLNFGASITSDRDHRAYQDLLTTANLPANWTEQYFHDCEQGILVDIATALANDTKTINFETFASALTVGQMVIWNARDALDAHQQTIEAVLSARQLPWFCNIISICETKSYLFCQDAAVQTWLSQLLELQFDANGLAVANRMWLRKEIMKADQLQ